MPFHIANQSAIVDVVYGVPPPLVEGSREVARLCALLSREHIYLNFYIQKADYKKSDDRKGVPKNQMYRIDRAVRPGRLAIDI